MVINQNNDYIAANQKENLLAIHHGALQGISNNNNNI